ncbi:DNA-binding transcriptional LysR family regulator [Kibdelosporangium banguiense]|uniref:DNA-binding transcriptional LysR family regulator n=1 Tax=Kibdelosporangium banguiense TaxID=1365924 RepID=A0ABS4TCN0_9PSEU|nr:LysR family transcriptional regulator [Kibdelosporangium banguiense]MBP2322101.1 DNA-binding transcriptional LysR family regulator [Kibdelosporangium banguiense]
MELRQLEYFVAVAEECHFTRAAKRMHVAQSGLSSAIRSLERELGASLFLRSTRQVELTPAGRALLVEARRALSATDAARDAVAAVQGLIRGSLAVGSLQCLHVVNLPRVLAGFHGAHPGVEIRLKQGGSGELMDQIRAGRLDIAFVAMPRRQVDDLRVRPLASEPFVLACGLEHRLADRQRVSIDDLDGEPFVDFQPDWGSRDAVDAVLADRRIAFEVNDVHSLLDLVMFGLGVALVPQSFSVKTDKVQFVGLADQPPPWQTGVVTSPAPSAAATALLDAVAAAKSGAG